MILGFASQRPVQLPCELSIQLPHSHKIIEIIHETIKHCLENGPGSELKLHASQKNNDEYRFIFDVNSKDHLYFRWKLHSVLVDKSFTNWNTQPIQMTKDGPTWIPPPHLFDEDSSFFEDKISDSSNSSTDDEILEFPRGVLSPQDAHELRSLLRRLTLDRSRISEIMVFCIIHSSASEEIVSTIIRSLVNPFTYISKKWPRLYLLHDLLHNCSVVVPNAWTYHRLIETNIEAVLEHFGALRKSIESRLKAEEIRFKVMFLLTLWEDWSFFPADVIQEFKLKFEGKSDDQKKIEVVEQRQETLLEELKQDFQKNASYLLPLEKWPLVEANSNFLPLKMVATEGDSFSRPILHLNSSADTPGPFKFKMHKPIVANRPLLIKPIVTEKTIPINSEIQAAIISTMEPKTVKAVKPMIKSSSNSISSKLKPKQIQIKLKSKAMGQEDVQAQNLIFGNDKEQEESDDEDIDGVPLDPSYFQFNILDKDIQDLIDGYQDDDGDEPIVKSMNFEPESGSRTLQPHNVDMFS